MSDSTVHLSPSAEPTQAPVKKQGDNLTSKDIKDRILHTLTVYPRLSSAMLQMGIGPYIKSQAWSPLLEEMIAEGVVVREYVTLRSPAGRIKPYTMLRLAQLPELNTLMLDSKTAASVIAEEDSED